MALLCCEFTAPIMLGDSVAVVTIEAGTPLDMENVVVVAEGCSFGTDNCAYQDTYDDVYCDITNGGAVPNARVPNVTLNIDLLPAGHVLTIDAVERTVVVTQDGTQVGGVDAVSFIGLLPWIEAARGGCARVCIDATDWATAVVNADTTVSVDVYDREL